MTPEGKAAAPVTKPSSAGVDKKIVVPAEAVEEIFGEDLTEEMRDKTATLFEAAVNEKVNVCDNKCCPNNTGSPDSIISTPLDLWIEPWGVLHWCDVFVCFHAYNIAYIGMYVKD